MRIEKRKIAQITPSVVAHPSHRILKMAVPPLIIHPSALPPIKAKKSSIMMRSIVIITIWHLILN